MVQRTVGGWREDGVKEGERHLLLPTSRVIFSNLTRLLRMFWCSCGYLKQGQEREEMKGVRSQSTVVS